MNFDTVIDRRATNSIKWDGMEKLYGVSPDDGISMWVADTDFRAADCIQDAVTKYSEHGVYGYFGDDTEYRAAICWWMKNRHGWDIKPNWIFSTHGLVNGTALCVDTFTKPGDGVVLFTPVYHSFARKIAALGRNVVEMKLVNNDGRYEMDFETYDAAMTGTEKMVILCSPHNPGGRVWTKSELQEVGEFCKRHDLILISDEIHHDLTYAGHIHTPTATIPGYEERLITLTAPSKTFNIAGASTGQVIIADNALRAGFGARVDALGLSPNSFGLFMTTAAYSPAGAAWVEELRAYIDINRKLFDEGINAIPGLASMHLESTYLAWVDFTATGMTRNEFTTRVEQSAKIAVNHGPTFGSGGENFLRFNFATQRDRVKTAIARLQEAFGDLQ